MYIYNLLCIFIVVYFMMVLNVYLNYYIILYLQQWRRTRYICLLW